MSDKGWRTQPLIQAAKTVCKSTGKTAVIIAFIDDRADTIEWASYGIDGPRCDRAGALLDALATYVEDGQ